MLLTKCTYKTTKVFNIRKRQNLSNFHFYCTLICLFCSKKVIQRVEKVQYKTLQVLENNYMATYNYLWSLENKIKIHQRPSLFLAIEICKSRNKLDSCFMWKTYVEENIPNSLRRGVPLLVSYPNTGKHGINSEEAIFETTYQQTKKNASLSSNLNSY